jgi:hydroxypyruvate isomerase
MEKMTRREVIRAGVVAGAGLAAGSVLAAGAASEAAESDAAGSGGSDTMKGPFKLNYGPHFGMFQHHAGPDLVDQLKFAADEGFRAWEDNGMKGRPVAEQERIAKAMQELDITMGVFVVNMGTAWTPTLSTGRQDALDRFLQECRESVEVAKRVNAKWMTVVPGNIEPRLHPGYQTSHVVEALRRASEIFEPHGLVMVLEPLNFRDHPSLFLTDIGQAYLICRAVNSPACKILLDFYHTQIQEGNLIPNADLAWSEVAYLQIGDNPGRREPTTGEVNYRNVFKHVHAKGFRGVLGMEHGVARSSREGERALIEAYRWSDDF